MKNVKNNRPVIKDMLAAPSKKVVNGRKPKTLLDIVFSPHNKSHVNYVIGTIVGNEDGSYDIGFYNHVIDKRHLLRKRDVISTLQKLAKKEGVKILGTAFSVKNGDGSELRTRIWTDLDSFPIFINGESDHIENKRLRYLALAAAEKIHRRRISRCRYKS